MLTNKHMMILENSSVQLVFLLVQCKEWMSVSADIVNGCLMT